MAVRYVGKATIYILYNDKCIYDCKVVVKKRSTVGARQVHIYSTSFTIQEPHRDQLPPRPGEPDQKCAYDSPETYDMMAASAAVFAFVGAGDHLSKEETQENSAAFEEAMQEALQENGRYKVRRRK